MSILRELQDKQKRLDDFIIKKHDLEGQDLLQNKIIALDVELSEFANEVEFFKYWKENKGKGRELEEACDCLHFILSIANDLNCDLDEYVDFNYPCFLNESLNSMYLKIKDLLISEVLWSNTYTSESGISMILENFISMIKELGFTFDDLVKEYNKKYEINIKRQEEGY